jgi:hypothetical protein
MSASASASWDAEYASGRYEEEPPVRFTADIIAAAKSRNLRHGLYVGCGNGRNFAPMNDAGLNLLGLDISDSVDRPHAIEQRGEGAKGGGSLVQELQFLHDVPFRRMGQDRLPADSQNRTLKSQEPRL